MSDFQFRRNNFDIIRLVAALQVVIIHGYEHLGFNGNSAIIKLIGAFPGVPIFFVVSGFLISASYERSTSIKSYFKNRVLRIYPALWSCLLISVITIFLFFKPETTFISFFSWIIAQLSIGQVYNPDFLRGYGVGVLNGSLWTIPIEIQFYILLPLIYVIFKKVKDSNVFLISAILILAILNQLFNGQLLNERTIMIKFISITVLPYLFLFLLGVFLEKNLVLVEKYLANKAKWYLLIYMTAVIVSYLIGIRYQGNHINPISALLLSCLTISAAYSKVDIFRNILKGNDISYGVYIYHMVFINMLLHISTFEPIVNFIITFLLTTLFAYLSWKIVEEPTLALKTFSIRDIPYSRT